MQENTLELNSFQVGEGRAVVGDFCFSNPSPQNEQKVNSSWTVTSTKDGVN
jgi:hypothetical protein